MLRRSSVMIVAGLLLLTACSSASKDKQPGAGLQLGAGTTTPGGDAASAAAPGQAAAGQPGGQGGNPSNPAGAGAADGGSSGVTPASGGSGATPTGKATPSSAGEIRVGLYYTDTGPSIAGAQGLAAGDGRAQAQAVIDYIQAHGGFGGRRVKLFTYGVSIAEYGVTQDQAACTKFTQDDKVFISIQVAVHTPTYQQCMAERGVAVLDVSLTVAADRATMDKYANFLYQTTASSDRLGSTWGDAMIRQGYVNAATNLGVIYTDTPYNITTVKTFLARLATAGVRPKAKNVIATDGSQSQAQNAVVQFRGDGVTHVAVVSAATFMSVAGGQGYNPRYTIVKLPLALTATNTPPSALSNAVTIGYQPGFDVESAQEGTPTPAAQRCLKIMRDSGNAPGTRIADGQARYTCDSLFWLKAVADRAKAMGARDFTVGTMRAAVESLGTGFETAGEFSMRFGVGRHDGSEQYRDLAYDVGCKCFQYRGPLRPFSA